nr:hypothetical protein [Tanacetum cinerariifolium]
MVKVVTIVKQKHDLDTVSYHKLFDVLKQYQKEVNEIHTERIAKNANPLAFVVAAQQYSDPYYQAPKSHKSYAPQSKQSSFTRSNASTKFKGKEIAKPITHLSELAYEEDIDPKQAQKDKEMQKNLALIAKKPKRVKDSTYHKEKMLLCKQAKKEDTYEEIDEQEVEAHYSFMAKIQEHSEKPESTSNTCLVEKDDSNVTPGLMNMCDNDIQTDQNAEDECVVLDNLIAYLKLDVDENKKIQ